MKLSIVVPAYNEEAYLPECLQAATREAQAARRRADVEVLVVDNASTDGTGYVAAGFAGVRVVREPRKGLTRARQAGLESARGDVLAYVDADTRMPPGWVDRVIDAFEADPGVVCVSGPYVYYDLPAIRRALVRAYWLLLARPTYLMTGYMAVGGNFAARRAALEAIGGFDTRIAFYGEDTDIARRLSAVGTVAFDMQLVMPTSARRLHAEGFSATALRYMGNFLSEALRKRPLTEEYRDIR